MEIKNTRRLRTAYELLYILQESGRGDSDHAKNLKREIRRYTNAPLAEKRIVRDDGMDGFVSLEMLPDWIGSEEEAVEFFEDYLYIQPLYSAYDCTGRPFTSWYKVFRRGDRFWAYHCVGYDV